ncbi:MAG TPA: efflux RND transporter periplasmic adaptor subunit [Hyphomonadaceae bacterium]|nr:efflux RND transporter periplasmic adaptor subunit [Hyphomonadaceae bacterium]HPI47619.1 efflux RND transporter periplasmic adaptor subunit [Hyphomonadaceae bacterium]
MNTFKLTILVAAAASALMAGSCGEKPSGAENGAEAAAASGEYERGPHRGRMLRDGPFAIEMTIFEDGVDPEFHVYAYENDKPLPPTEVQLGVELMRLGNRIDRFAFAPREDYLLGNGAVTEPHSFQVKVTATRGGKTYEWNYDSFEGRTTIARDQADAAGVKVEPAGPAAIDEIVALTGRVELQPEGRAEVRAWYPGRIVSMTRSIGDRVEKGQTLATVMSSESLQTYAIPAPISGVIMERNATPGDVAGAAPLYVIADPRKLHAEFFIYPRDAERLRAGQPVTVTSVGGASTLKAKIEVILPTSDLLTQTVVAHVELPNPDGVTWRPGQAVEGSVVVASDDVPLAVRTRALQRFRDFTVVYARVDDTYEVRMLELGRQSPEWTEVLGGLAPGEVYVSDNAFLIRADVEKTGASHDH